MLYDKHATTIDDQITQLKIRALQISDDAIARHYLSKQNQVG
jgi:hypothetical protein